MIWTLLLFAVGLFGALGFYDKVFGFSDQVRYFNSGLLVLLSMIMLVRTWAKIRAGRTEKLIARNNELEKMVGQTENTRSDKKREPAPANYR